MALAISLSRCVFFPPHHLSILDSQTTPRTSLSTSKPLRHFPSVASHQAQIVLDRPAIAVAEAVSEAELWAAACLRVRSFYDFDPTTYAVEVSHPSTSIPAYGFVLFLFLIHSVWYLLHFFFGFGFRVPFGVGPTVIDQCVARFHM